jgi:hypothetical protein
MSHQAESAADQLLGSWQLLSIQIRFEDTGELVDLHGPNPRGFIVFAPGGRVAVVITSGDRQPAANDMETAALFRDMTAYTGRVRIEGGTMFNEVDVAWQPAWENTPQPRHFLIEGDRLTLTTDVQVHPSRPGRQLRGIIVWTREK